MKCHPDTLSVTHIFDGEEVVSGGADGQEWVATFASVIDAEHFIDDARGRSAMVDTTRDVVIRIGVTLSNAAQSITIVDP